MDSVPDQVMFSFRNLRSTVDDPKASWQLLLRVVADFVVIIEGRQIYTESEFPVIEFASQAEKWLRNDGCDFFYISMESDEEPLLAFYRQADGRFLFYSPHQMFEVATTIDGEALRAALMASNDELRCYVSSKLYLDIGGLL